MCVSEGGQSTGCSGRSAAQPAAEFAEQCADGTAGTQRPCSQQPTGALHETRPRLRNGSAGRVRGRGAIADSLDDLMQGVGTLPKAPPDFARPAFARSQACT